MFLHVALRLPISQPSRATRREDGAACADDDLHFAARDAPRQIEIEQEVLAEPFAGVEPVCGDCLAQRRQGRDRIHFQMLRRRAISSAISMAAIRLAGSARPVPAMSSAVPWSGEVRTNGNPTVTFTPPEKSIVLIGISAWS